VAGIPAVISPEHSEVAVLVVPTNEEWEIARQVMDVMRMSTGKE
jgi:acetate kinase